MIASVVLCITIAFSDAQAECDEAGRIKNLKTQAVEISNFLQNYNTTLSESFEKVSENDWRTVNVPYDVEEPVRKAVNIDICIAFQNNLRETYNLLLYRGNSKCRTDALMIGNGQLVALLTSLQKSNDIISQLVHLEFVCSEGDLLGKGDHSQLELLQQSIQRIKNQTKPSYSQVNDDTVNSATRTYSVCFGEFARKMNVIRKSHEHTIKACIKWIMNPRG